MGEIEARVRLENEADLFLHEEGRVPKEKIRTQEIDAVVDTGAVVVGRKMKTDCLVGPESPFLPTLKLKGAL